MKKETQGEIGEIQLQAKECQTLSPLETGKGKDESLGEYSPIGTLILTFSFQNCQRVSLLF